MDERSFNGSYYRVIELIVRIERFLSRSRARLRGRTLK